MVIIIQTTNKCIYYVLEYKEMINMAEQVLVQFRADKALKEEVADIQSAWHGSSYCFSYVYE